MLLKILLPIVFLLSQMQIVFAESALNSNEALHLAAHTGGSYALTHLSKVLCTQMIGKEKKIPCLLTGVGISLAAGTAKEFLLDRGESKKTHLKGFAEDGLGVGLAATLISIDW